MFCIAAFIILGILAIFSAKYRRMARQAWSCVARRLTLRPCDTNFKDEVKNRLLAPIALKKPRLMKAANIGIELAAFLLVVLTIWSLYTVVKSGLNLYVYGTCNPSNSESCNIGNEACSITSAKPTFLGSIKDMRPQDWFVSEAKSFAETVTNIPTRMQNWKAEEYLPANVSYYRIYDPTKPTALEIIDPGCYFCKKLVTNQEEADFADRYNLAYIAYPITNPLNQDEYKFKNSMLVSRYLEATKLHPLKNATTPADWQILKKIFLGRDQDGYGFQEKINLELSNEETEGLLHEWLSEMGYSEEEAAIIKSTARSEKVARAIQENKRIVDERVKTVKIPTIIFDGKRHGGVLKVDQLR